MNPPRMSFSSHTPAACSGPHLPALSEHHGAKDGSKTRRQIDCDWGDATRAVTLQGRTQHGPSPRTTQKIFCPRKIPCLADKGASIHTRPLQVHDLRGLDSHLTRWEIFH